jgi:predicted Zn-dependent protease
VKNFYPAFDKGLHDAFTEWVKGMGGAISIQYVKSKQESNIDCFFTDNFSQVHSIAEGGEAQLTWTNDGNFNHCTIVLLTAHAADNLTPSVNEIKGVCLHEIGHALGLNGHSPNSDDIMYCSETNNESKIPQLTARDLATLKKLYG